MGREIRRVPANWQHPQHTNHGRLEFQPLRDGYERALAGFADDIAKHGLAEAIEDHGGGPLKEDFVDYEGRPCDWWQLYESVTEGTPVTPPFATAEELIEYLVNRGDRWGRGSPMSRAAAERLVRGGWAPSFIISDGQVLSGAEGLAALDD